MSGRIPWTLTDTQTLDVYALPVNPSEESVSPDTISKSIVYSVQAGLRQTNSGVDTVDNIVYSSGQDIPTAQYSGTVYDKDDLDDLIMWTSKEYPLELQDDLGRRYEVLMDGLDSLTPERSQRYPWKHTYSMSFMVLQRLT